MSKGYGNGSRGSGMGWNVVKWVGACVGFWLLWKIGSGT